MVFYEWVERCETGKTWDLLCKKCSLKSTLCCLTPLLSGFGSGFWGTFGFCLFCFFLPWMLGFCFSRLQRILCLVFHLFVVFSPYTFPFMHLFFPKNKLGVFFPPNLPFLEFTCWDSLKLPPHSVTVFTSFCLRLW